MDFLPKALAFGQFDWEWEHASSLDPSAWHYEDIETFYAFGRCHHLAIALHRALGWQIGAIMETDPDWLDDDGLPLPIHVFAVPDIGKAFDARGQRTTDEVCAEMYGTGSISRGRLQLWDSEQDFRTQIIERSDRPLKAVTETDLARTAKLVPSRIWTLGEEFRCAIESWRSAQTSPSPT